VATSNFCNKKNDAIINENLLAKNYFFQLRFNLIKKNIEKCIRFDFYYNLRKMFEQEKLKKSILSYVILLILIKREFSILNQIKL